MTRPSALTTLRTVSASAALAFAGVTLAQMTCEVCSEAVAPVLRSVIVPMTTLTVLTFVAALAMARAGLVAQVFSRGIAWLVFATASWFPLWALSHGESPFESAHMNALLAGAGLALALSWPAMHTRSIKRAFSPTSYRHWFLAGAVASVMAAASTLLVAYDHANGRRLPIMVALVVLGGALVLAAIGVARMRAWGVLLGLVASGVTFTIACFHPYGFTALGVNPGWPNAIPAVLVALPAIFFLVPLGLAHRRARIRARRSLAFR